MGVMGTQMPGMQLSLPTNAQQMSQMNQMAQQQGGWAAWNQQQPSKCTCSISANIYYF